MYQELVKCIKRMRCDHNTIRIKIRDDCMIYIYNDFGGTHTTMMAVAYHLNQLPQSERKLTTDEILKIKYFNKLTKEDFGKLIFHGKDEDGHSVYTIGRRSQDLVIPALKDLFVLLQEKYNFDERIVFSNTSPTVPFPMTMGGFFSRTLKIDSIGVPLLVMGAKQCCENVFRLVEYTKEVGKSDLGKKIVVLNNELFKS